MKQVLLKSAIIVTASIAVTSTASAQGTQVGAGRTPSLEPSNEPEFGQRGQWYLYAPTLMAFHTRYASPVPVTSINSLSAALEVGTFVRNHLSLGLAVTGDYAWQSQPLDPSIGGTDGYTNWSTAFELVAGWQRPLAAWVSFWPKLKLGGSYGRYDQSVYDSTSGTQSNVQASMHGFIASLRLPLVLHVTRHLFAELAWELRTGFIHNYQYDSYQATGQASIGLGGWL